MFGSVYPVYRCYYDFGQSYYSSHAFGRGDPSYGCFANKESIRAYESNRYWTAQYQHIHYPKRNERRIFTPTDRSKLNAREGNNWKSENNKKHFRGKRQMFKRINKRRNSKKCHYCCNCSQKFKSQYKLKLHEKTSHAVTYLSDKTKQKPQIDTKPPSKEDNQAVEMKSEHKASPTIIEEFNVEQNCNSLQFVSGINSCPTPNLQMGDAKLQCPCCPKSFSTILDLSKHFSVHTPLNNL